ncbi:uncharacterized protein Cadr_000028990 [Camelus dromedarius]|uniref:Uncharacterized protein n=1 Tax=Camelus dromedarius TaxID=9838 RepID=A0A5N4C7U9_CAMDR|nr:uncharacterized protein Cadr_000028990 [Camelus dromedarius]
MYEQEKASGEMPIKFPEEKENGEPHKLDTKAAAATAELHKDTSQSSVTLLVLPSFLCSLNGAKQRNISVIDPALEGHATAGHTYEQLLKQPASQERSQGLRSEDSSLHYADIQVCSGTQPRSAQEVKHLQMENATEYAILCFPQATPRYDNKNGTLV